VSPTIASSEAVKLSLGAEKRRRWPCAKPSCAPCASNEPTTTQAATAPSESITLRASGASTCDASESAAAESPRVDASSGARIKRARPSANVAPKVRNSAASAHSDALRPINNGRGSTPDARASAMRERLGG
jgi:hypothetical protein